jgi:hypothetical protein
MDEGLGEGVVEAIYLNNRTTERVINFYLTRNIIYDVLKCQKLYGDFNNHATKGKAHEAHRSIEHIGGFV